MTYKFTYRVARITQYGGMAGSPITVSVLADGPREAAQEVQKVLPRKDTTDWWDIQVVSIEVQA